VCHPPDGGQLSVAPRKVVRRGFCCVQVEPACILDELVFALSLSSFTHLSGWA
jgi:hypothetical protein